MATAAKAHNSRTTDSMVVGGQLRVPVGCFAAVPVSENTEYALWISAAEIYNNKIRVLLVDPEAQTSNVDVPGARKRNREPAIRPSTGVISDLKKVRVRTLEVRQHPRSPPVQCAGNLRVGSKARPAADDHRRMQRALCGGTQEAHRLLARARRNRATGATERNSSSSRSHAIYTIKVVKVAVHGDLLYEVSGGAPRSARCA